MIARGHAMRERPEPRSAMELSASCLPGMRRTGKPVAGVDQRACIHVLLEGEHAIIGGELAAIAWRWSTLTRRGTRAARIIAALLAR